MVQVEEEVMVLMEAKDHMVVVAAVVVEWVEPRKTLEPIYKLPTGTVSN